MRSEVVAGDNNRVGEGGPVRRTDRDGVPLPDLHPSTAVVEVARKKHVVFNPRLATADLSKHCGVTVDISTISVGVSLVKEQGAVLHLERAVLLNDVIPLTAPPNNTRVPP